MPRDQTGKLCSERQDTVEAIIAAVEAETTTDTAYRQWSTDRLERLVAQAGMCVGEPMRTGRDDWYVPAQPGAARGENARAARAACRGCPVTRACLERTLRMEAGAEDCWGLAGATNPRQRRKILRERGWWTR